NRKNVHHEAGLREGRWIDIGAYGDDPVRQDVFTLWIDHGVRPRDAKYDYVVLPNATRAQTSAAAEELRALVLENSDKLQAAYESRAQIAAIAFHEAGEAQVGEH